MEDSAAHSEAFLKRRRGRAFVTSNACVECRRKKAKCDGGALCGRCAVQDGAECIYETTVRLSKEALGEEIADLRAQLQRSDTAVQNLRALLQQKEAGVQSLFTLPSSGYVSQQGNPMSFGGISTRSDLSLSASELMGVPGLSQTLAQAHILEQSTRHTEAQTQPGTVERWTAVTSDREFIQHLCTLYFKWEYPLFASVSKEHFLADFRTGRQNYCSPLLVNAILAVGCRFSDRPEARASLRDENPGSHFFTEAKSLLAQQKRHSLTITQALGLMSIWEASSGRDSESWFYSGQAIRIAVEMGLQKQSPEFSPDDQIVRTATFWGAFTLNQAWCLNVGQLPHFSMNSDPLPKPLTVDRDQISDWVWQTEYKNALEQVSQQSSDTQSIYNCFCHLSEIVHSSFYVLYDPVSSVTSTEILIVYTRYLEWYSSLPRGLRQDSNPSPAALFIQYRNPRLTTDQDVLTTAYNMFYHYAIMLLFRPFINFRIIKSSVVPHDVCLQAADNISSLLQSYNRLYGIRNTPAFMPCITLASSIAHLMAADDIIPTTKGAGHVRQGGSDLQSMSAHNPFARRAIYILKILARNWGVAISIDGPTDMNHAEQACKPSTGSMNFFCPDQEGFKLLRRSIHDYENSPLFTPFPMQGLPIMLVDEASLRESGFSRMS